MCGFQVLIETMHDQTFTFVKKDLPSMHAQQFVSIRIAFLSALKSDVGCFARVVPV